MKFSNSVTAPKICRERVKKKKGRKERDKKGEGEKREEKNKKGDESKRERCIMSATTPWNSKKDIKTP